MGLPSISLEAGDLSLDWGEGKWRHRECHFPFLPFTTSLDVFLPLGKCVLCEVVHSALLTVLSLGPVGQAWGLRGSLLGPHSGWATGVVSFMQMPVYTPLPSKKLYFLTPSMGKFWIEWKQICQNLCGMWGDVTRKLWQLEV